MCVCVVCLTFAFVFVNCSTRIRDRITIRIRLIIRLLVYVCVLVDVVVFPILSINRCMRFMFCHITSRACRTRNVQSRSVCVCVCVLVDVLVLVLVAVLVYLLVIVVCLAVILVCAFEPSCAIVCTRSIRNRLMSGTLNRLLISVKARTVLAPRMCTRGRRRARMITINHERIITRWRVSLYIGIMFSI